jgi:hypothetical protein
MTERHIVLIPDCHHPFQDSRALRAVIRYIELTQPHEVCILGDYLDCLAPARWSKGLAAEFAAGLDREANAGRETLTALRAVYGGGVTFLEGNHEARIRKYVTSVAPALAGIVRMVPELLDFKGFDVQPQGQPYRIAPDTVAIHGDLLSKDAGKSAWKEMMRHGRNVVQGHSHRLGLMFETSDRTRFALEAGWLGDIRRAGYLSFKGVANWQQGFGELRVIGNRVFPSVIRVQGGTIAVAGLRVTVGGE